MTKHFSALALAATLALPFATARADGEADAVRSSQVVWSAFQCAVLAHVAGDKVTAEHRIAMGSRRGVEYLKWAEGVMADRGVGPRGTAVGFILVAEGPTHEFALGRVYQYAHERVSKDLMAANSATGDELRDSARHLF